MSAGEELESDRYLITIEERLDSSADHAQGCNSQRVEEREVSNTPGIYQPNKRKRQVCVSLEYTLKGLYRWELT